MKWISVWKGIGDFAWFIILSSGDGFWNFILFFNFNFSVSVWFEANEEFWHWLGKTIVKQIVFLGPIWETYSLPKSDSYSLAPDFPLYASVKLFWFQTSFGLKGKILYQWPTWIQGFVDPDLVWYDRSESDNLSCEWIGLCVRKLMKVWVSWFMSTGLHLMIRLTLISYSLCIWVRSST